MTHLLAVLFLGPVPCEVAANVRPDPMPSVVMVRQGNGVGTGTVVGCEGGQSLILTCAHVAPTAEACTVVRDGKTYPAAVLDRDKWSDLALLTVAADLPVVTIADATPADGSEVVQLGHTHAGPVRKAVGKLLGWDGSTWGQTRTVVQATSCPADNGDSGCGTFAGGRLVAVVSCKGVAIGPGPAQCVHLADVRRFVRDAGAKAFPKLHKRLCETDVYPPKSATVIPPAPLVMPGRS